jgi:hypothetical protein
MLDRAHESAPAFAGAEWWRWRGSNPLNRPCLQGSVVTVQHLRATRARAGTPWTSECRGFGPASPRHQLANPTSFEAGALPALLRLAVEALRQDAGRGLRRVGEPRSRPEPTSWTAQA